MANKLKKYINYVKEAFFWPMHMIGLVTASVVTGALMVALPYLVPGFNPLFLLMALGGLEMLYLGFATNNGRFIRAINAKYADEINAFQKTRAITEYYNGMSAPRQRRFEGFTKKLDEIRENYQKMHGNYPEIINSFLKKISNLKFSYVRLLYMQDRSAALLERDKPETVEKEIAEIKSTMSGDPQKLKAIKEKRIGLMTKRIAGYQKAKENGQIVIAQLQTIEEMVNYIKDQPMAMKSTEADDTLIDNILFETEQMEETITDMESIMGGEMMVPDFGEMDGEGSGGERIKE